MRITERLVTHVHEQEKALKIQLLIGNIRANKAKNRTKAGGLSTKEILDFVRTLSASGGSAVPAAENGIDALVEEKYKL